MVTSFLGLVVHVDVRNIANRKTGDFKINNTAIKIMSNHRNVSCWHYLFLWKSWRVNIPPSHNILSVNFRCSDSIEKERFKCADVNKNRGFHCFRQLTFTNGQAGHARRRKNVPPAMLFFQAAGRLASVRLSCFCYFLMIWKLNSLSAGWSQLPELLLSRIQRFPTGHPSKER